MLTRLRLLVTVLLLLVGLFTPRVDAQTSITSTTLSTALTATGNRVVVAASTDLTAGNYVFIDREAMLIQSVSGTTAEVVRGFAGTGARAHAASAIVYLGAPARFARVEGVGPCTATDEAFTPRIVLPTGNLYTCTGGYWNKLGNNIDTQVAMFVQGATPADALDSIFFLADRPYVVTQITAIWGTAESTGSMDIDVEKLTGTTACASGTSLTTAAIAATGTANTLNTGTLTTTAANLLLAAGDRLCVDLTATPNEVANMVVTVRLAPR